MKLTVIKSIFNQNQFIDEDIIFWTNSQLNLFLNT